MVEFPDLPGCVTWGENLEQAIERGIDAASGWILGELADGKQIPRASEYSEIIVKEGCIVNMLRLDIEAYGEKRGIKAVRKNLTIPAGLNAFAKENNINFSKLLQNALLVLAQAK